jgi:ribosomal protein S18 acetylase RimI-like enzyme
VQTPQGPDDATLARLALANEIDLWSRSVAFAPAGASGRAGSAAWFTSGLPLPFFNQVMTIAEAADAASVEAGVDELRARRVPFQVRIRSGLDDHIVPAIEALGLHEDPDEAFPAMTLHPIPDDIADPATMPEGLEVRRADDAAGLADHVNVVAAAFGLPLEIARQFLVLEELAMPGFELYAGYVDGRAVSSSLGYVADGTVGIYNVATLREARGLGLGGALTRYAIAEGRRRGATVAILQASAMGRHLYETIGFREVLRFRVFAETPEGTSR